MKVCIVGDSLVSLTLAKTLVNEGIHVDLIYDYSTKIINKTRTIGITKTNINFFNKKILDISKLSWKINKIEIFLEKFKKKKVLNFDNNKKYLFSIIKNHRLYEILNNCLKNDKFFKRKKFLTNKFLNNDTYQLIINCDQKSSLTKKFFYKKINKNYNSKAYVTIIKHKKITQNNIAYQIFTELGPVAFLPVSDAETSIVYSIKKNTKKLKKIEIFNLIKKYNPKYSIMKIENVESFHLVSSNLRYYYHNNILAFGDLLHKIHPLAGQGFNMCIRDIKQLLQIIKNKTSLGLEIDSSVCLDFENKSKHKNYLFSSGIDFIYEFFNLESSMKDNRLGKVVEFFGKNKSLKNFVTKFADDGF